MASPTRTNNPIKNSVQEIMNKSFDSEFEINAFEIVAYDNVTGTIKRVNFDALNNFSTNDIDSTGDASSTIYEGQEDNVGTWAMMRGQLSGTVESLRYATQRNNPSITSYSSAWTNRATLTYGTYSQAF